MVRKTVIKYLRMEVCLLNLDTEEKFCWYTCAFSKAYSWSDLNRKSNNYCQRFAFIHFTHFKRIERSDQASLLINRGLIENRRSKGFLTLLYI